tara:strand:- start:1358 stop:1645 length:288 start_codon:yes stop_codon:yes gene_type:complete
MNRNTEIIQLRELHDVESSLNTNIGQIYDYPPAKKIAEKLFELNDELNILLNKRSEVLNMNLRFGSVGADTSHLNDEDFGAFIRGEINEYGDQLK